MVDGIVSDFRMDGPRGCTYKKMAGRDYTALIYLGYLGLFRSLLYMRYEGEVGDVPMKQR